MKVDLRKTLTEYDGKPIVEKIMNKETKQVEELPLTLLTALSTIVNASFQNELPTAEDLSKRNFLSVKIYSSKEPNITESEIDLILERVPKVYPSPRMYGILLEAFGRNQYDTETLEKEVPPEPQPPENTAN